MCGDSIKITPETCDDGNALAGDGCSTACLQENGWSCVGTGAGSCTVVCGDGIIIAGHETCDDSNSVSGDGCSSVCSVEAGFSCTGTPSVCSSVCGDGLI